MTHKYLLKSYKGNMEARDHMHIAQCLAGMAFSNALLGITHSMAHKTGAVFHIPHGCANAIFLPYVIDFNKGACTERYAEIARFIKLPGNTEDELIDSLTDMIRSMDRSMNIPLTLKDYGVSESDFKNNLNRISHNAMEDACTGANPAKITEEEMKKLFQYIYEGKKVDF
jgi:alcohol dehydrogenase class IV